MIGAALGLLLIAAPLAAEPLYSEEGYRIGGYRGEVPVELEGAVVVEPDAAYALWRTGRVAFIDVLPQAPKPKNLPEGTIWRDKPRDTIPGALWLPNTGYGRLAPAMLDYLHAGLDAATGGDKDHPVLFFCLDACWMSWNAARRALAEGHERVFWMPTGTDGWSFYNYPLERAAPFPGHP